jgi:hypothetical protein
MSSTAIVLRRPAGVGDAVSDVANGITSVIALLQQTKAAVGNDLVVGPQLTNAIAQLQSMQSTFGPAVQTIQTLQAQVTQLQGQLAQCESKPPQTIVTTPVTPAAPTGVTPSTAAFVAVGSAVVGGIAGYVARGKMRRGKP